MGKLKNMVKYITDTKERRKKALYNRGYNWAVGALLSTRGMDEVEKMLDCAKDFHVYNEFDVGARQALIDWAKGK